MLIDAVHQSFGEHHDNEQSVRKLRFERMESVRFRLPEKRFLCVFESLEEVLA